MELSQEPTIATESLSVRHTADNARLPSFIERDWTATALASPPSLVRLSLRSNVRSVPSTAVAYRRRTTAAAPLDVPGGDGSAAHTASRERPPPVASVPASALLYCWLQRIPSKPQVSHPEPRVLALLMPALLSRSVTTGRNCLGRGCRDAAMCPRRIPAGLSLRLLLLLRLPLPASDASSGDDISLSRTSSGARVRPASVAASLRLGWAARKSWDGVWPNSFYQCRSHKEVGWFRVSGIRPRAVQRSHEQR